MFLTQHNIFTGLIAMGIIGAALIIIEVSVKKQWLTKLWGRKLLHCTAICTCVWCIHNFGNRLALGFIFLVFFFILLWVIKKGWLQVNNTKTYGIALFSAAFSFLLFIPLFTISSIVYAGLILAFADAFAGIVGEKFDSQKIIFLFEEKSWQGFAAFFIAAFFVSFCYYSFSSFKLMLCIVLATLPSLTELFSYKGSDNFTVPVFSAVWFILLQYFPSGSLLIILLAAVAFSLLAAGAVIKKWLTASGAAAACWMALIFLVTGGFKAFAAPGIFLISGSLLSKLNNDVKEKLGRNAKQVFANGIIGAIFLVIYKLTKDTVFLTAAIMSFSISMADSVSSETGVYFKKTTFDIISFKKTAPGLSGGISLPGTLAGLAGALIIAAVTLIVYKISATSFLVITLAGFTGMIADSILGSLMQAKYKAANGLLLEAPETGTYLFKGWRWCTNDAVNLLSNALTTLLFLYILMK